MSSLIIGAAIGYEEPQIAPFVRSLERSGFQGDLMLLVDKNLGRVLRSDPRYRRHKVVVAPKWILHRVPETSRCYRLIWRYWGLLQRALSLYLAACDRLPLPPARRLALQNVFAQHCYFATETRYLHSYLFLHQYRYDRVLLSDVRDVLFQSDPFQSLPVKGLAVSMETRRLTLATEKFNARQITMAYGQEGLRRLGRRAISCCGVTYGDYESVQRYLWLMSREIFKLNRKAARYPMDQALHNHILWTGLFGDFHELDTLASPVATLAMLDEKDLRLSPDGRLLNHDGTAPSVVHQHDRWPRLAQILERTLAA